MSSNKSFGIVFFIVFLLVALYPLLQDQNIRLWSLICSFIFLFLGLINSIFLTPLNVLWNKIGIVLGKFVSPVVMGIIYFLVVFPTFLLVSIFKKNYLNIKYEKTKFSYWIESKNKNKNMEDQF